MLSEFYQHTRFRLNINGMVCVSIIRPHRSTTHVDAAYCYRPSSVVCWLSVCLSVGRSITVVSPADR